MSKLLHLLALGLLFHAGQIVADTLAGRVVDVGDGATVTVLDNAGARHKVRLAAIDAPEARQPFGKESRAHLSGLVLGKEARIEWRQHDRYGRVVGKLMVQAPDCPTCAPTRDAGLAQLEAGLAWWYREDRRQQSLEDQGYYEYAEFDARNRRIGLWQDEAPLPPWEWRRKNHVVAQAAAESSSRLEAADHKQYSLTWSDIRDVATSEPGRAGRLPCRLRALGNAAVKSASVDKRCTAETSLQTERQEANGPHLRSALDVPRG